MIKYILLQLNISYYNLIFPFIIKYIIHMKHTDHSK